MRAARRFVNSARLAVMARRERRVPFWPEEKIERLQRRRLRRITRHAWRTVPSWHREMEARGLRPGDFSEAGDLARLPLLSEREVRLRLDEFHSTRWKEEETLVLESSASAHGHVRKRIRWDPRTQLAKLAYAERDRAVVARLAGSGWGQRQLFALPEGSSSLILREWWDARVWTPTRLVRRASFPIDRPFEELVERLAEVRPSVVYSYGSFAERFFRWLEGTGASARLPRVWVYGGESMDPAWRERAERKGCRIYSTYQSVEAGRVGFECERREGFHLNVDLCAVRVVDEAGEDVHPGEEGEIVVSNLLNQATVLFNVRLGDRGILSPEPCPCGRGLPLLSRLVGRSWDRITLGDGREFSSLEIKQPFNEELTFALQVQVVHPRRGEIVWRVVPLPGVDVEKARRRLLSRSREVLGEETEVGVEMVEEIPSGPSGKARNLERPDG